METITYYHIELPQHDSVPAEGLPSDTGNRSALANGSVVALHPDFGAWTWEAAACAPLVVSGPKLTTVRHLIDSRTAKATARRRMG